MNKTVLTSFTILCLLPTVLLIGFNGPVKTSSGVIHVPDDYPTIQEAITYANPGDTVFVSNGTYYEHVVLNKELSLIGENKDTTVIDGNGRGTVVHMTANHITIRGFTIQNGWTYGIHIDHCEGHTIIGNVIRGNRLQGIILYSSGGNTFRDNNITGSDHNFGVVGSSLPHYVNDVDTSNIVDGKPIHYLVNQHNQQIIADAGYVGIINSTNVRAKNLFLGNNYQGLLSVCMTNSFIQNVTVKNCNYGIELHHSSNNTIYNNTLMKNHVGINLQRLYFTSERSNDNIIYGNNMTDNRYGIFLSYSDNNVVYDNAISLSHWNGIEIDWACYNKIYSNSISSSRWDGIEVLYYSSFNTIHHNNFFNNTYQAFEDETSYNRWDNGGEGNYWSDYEGNDSDSDAIGDEAYNFHRNKRDNYPLMGMFSDFKVTWQGETYHVTTICNSTISALRFDDDEGLMNFNVTGPHDDTGFCRVKIPRALIDVPYVILVGNEEVDATVLPISNATHAFLYFKYIPDTHQVMVATDPYYELLEEYNNLLAHYNTLNSTYYDLYRDYTTLNLTYYELLRNNALLSSAYNSLNSTYNELRSEQEATKSELNNIRNLMYIFITLTTILIANNVYFIKKHKH
ncbi:MAG: right-handed parallel beta-helix repeat-containing protein [Candidatus Bathyarchaeota archaeon]|nr:right-handed parallel beta-helix repeat-containing protein [Candidatus Bathyarchaeota archaeon]